MKSITIIALFAVLICFSAVTAKKSLSKKHLLRHRKSGKVLPRTPKGDLLSDHFGANSDGSPYGPQPTLIRKKVIIESEDGKKEERIVSKIIHLSDPGPNRCDMAKMDNFEVCMTFNSCDICSAAPQCGWCEFS